MPEAVAPALHAATQTLQGEWLLTRLATATEDFKTLFPSQQPYLSFDLDNLSISGSAGCNRLAGSFGMQQGRLDFTAPLAVTKMMCAGSGEALLLALLPQVNAFIVEQDTTLRLMKGDLELMRLVRR